jgi:hypothetical protein
LGTYIIVPIRQPMAPGASEVALPPTSLFDIAQRLMTRGDILRRVARPSITVVTLAISISVVSPAAVDAHAISAALALQAIKVDATVGIVVMKRRLRKVVAFGSRRS